MDQVGSRILPIGQLSSDKFSLIIGSLNDQEKKTVSPFCLSYDDWLVIKPGQILPTQTNKTFD